MRNVFVTIAMCQICAKVIVILNNLWSFKSVLRNCKRCKQLINKNFSFWFHWLRTRRSEVRILPCAPNIKEPALCRFFYVCCVCKHDENLGSTISRGAKLSGRRPPAGRGTWMGRVILPWTPK